MPSPESVPPRAADPAQETVTVARGNIYLALEICDAYFPNMQSVALIRREDRILIVPLMQESGGGLLLKIRNARGDRVIHAQEFFRAHGLDEDVRARTVPVLWSSESAALTVSYFPIRDV